MLLKITDRDTEKNIPRFILFLTYYKTLKGKGEQKEIDEVWQGREKWKGGGERMREY